MKWILPLSVGLVSLLAVLSADARLVDYGDDESCSLSSFEKEPKERFIKSLCELTTDDIIQWINLVDSFDQLDRDQLQNQLQKRFRFRLKSQTQSFVRLLEVVSKLDLTPDQKRSRIVTIALRQLSLIGRIHRTQVIDQEVQDLRESAGAALLHEPAKVDLARSLLDRALKTICGSKDRKHASSCQQISVELFRDMAWLAESELNFIEAARFYESAATVQASNDEGASYDLLNSAALWNDYAEATGQITAFNDVVRLHERVLEITTYADDPMRWIRAQVNLGIALRRLAGDRVDMDRLQQSATVLRTALDNLGQSNIAPNRVIATARTNLGITLYLIGELGRNEQSLEQSIAELWKALGDVERDRDPHLWVTLKNNLGMSLLSLGRATSDIQMLHNARDAFSDTLSVWSRVRAPERWGIAQLNLGDALLEISYLSSSNNAIQEALTAYRRALITLSQRHEPLIWASTQNKLGSTLNALGLTTKRPGLFQEAVKSFRLALSALKKDKDSTEWGRSHYGIGLAKYRLAISNHSVSEMKTAISSLKAASEVTKQNLFLRESILSMLFKAHSFVGVEMEDHFELQHALAAIKEARDIRINELKMEDIASRDVKMINSIEALIPIYKQHQK